MKAFMIRILKLLFGVILFAFGIVFTINANIGYGPWEVFHFGLSRQTGLGIGLVSVIVGIIIVIIATLLKEKLGLGTIAGMVLTGLGIDLILYLNFIPVSTNFAYGLVMLIIGMLVISLGSYFYMNSAFGVGPRDNLMVLLTRKTKLPIGVCRGIVELTVTLIGWLLGGMVGIGTLIFGIAVGFCIQITFAVFKFDAAAVQHETLRQSFTGIRKR